MFRWNDDLCSSASGMTSTHCTLQLHTQHTQPTPQRSPIALGTQVMSLARLPHFVSCFLTRTLRFQEKCWFSREPTLRRWDLKDRLWLHNIWSDRKKEKHQSFYINMTLLRESSFYYWFYLHQASPLQVKVCLNWFMLTIHWIHTEPIRHMYL